MAASSRVEALADLVSIPEPALMAEFGSWEGGSAIVFLQAARAANLELALICVDTWLGSKEHWENTFPNTQWSFDRLGVVDGQPTVFETFQQRLEEQGLFSKVKIVRAPTSHAAGYIARNFPPLDLVYVDADHTYRAVVANLRLAKTLLSASGLVAGDDWAWFSVRFAVARSSLGRYRIFTSPDATTYLLIPRRNRALGPKFKSRGWANQSSALLLAGGWLGPLGRSFRKSLRLAIDRTYISFRNAARLFRNPRL